MKKQMKFVILIMFGIIIFLIFAFLNLRVKLGYEIFGNNYCNTDHYIEGAGDAFTDWTCKLCGKNATNSDTNTPEICNICSILTRRCYKCGKLKK